MFQTMSILLLCLNYYYSCINNCFYRAYRSGPDHTLRDITKGEEMLANYLAFVADEEGWEEDILSTKGQCSGEVLGEVSAYENERGSG